MSELEFGWGFVPLSHCHWKMSSHAILRLKKKQEPKDFSATPGVSEWCSWVGVIFLLAEISCTIVCLLFYLFTFWFSLLACELFDGIYLMWWKPLSSIAVTTACLWNGHQNHGSLPEAFSRTWHDLKYVPCLHCSISTGSRPVPEDCCLRTSPIFFGANSLIAWHLQLEEHQELDSTKPAAATNAGISLWMNASEAVPVGHFCCVDSRW